MTITTPLAITPEIIRFAHQIAGNGRMPVWIDVDPRVGSMRAECFENVARAVEEEGGLAVMGWIIWQREGVWVEAEHHAVWQRPDGSLRDVTPTADGETRLLFLRHKRAIRVHPRYGLPTRFAPMSKDALIVSLTRRAERMRKVHYERLVAGATVDLERRLAEASHRYLQADAAVKAKFGSV